MKALVVSGGGSKGAFGGGVSQYLIEEQNKDYDIYIGSSTGSLLVPLLSIKKLDKLKEAYTNVTQKDIFKINPFKIKKNKNGSTKVAIDYINIIYNVFFRKKRSFGDASNLKTLIEKFLTERDYNITKENKKEVLICTTNMTLAKTEFKSNIDYGWKDYVEWMVSSATVPPFMEPITKGGYDYSDGGILENAPIQEAINRGATEVDVIILKKENHELNKERIRNPFHYIIRTVDIMMSEISRDDLRLRNLKIKDESVTLNIYHTPRTLTNNSLIFDKKTMSGWWDEGFGMASEGRFKTYELTKRRVPKLTHDGVTPLNDYTPLNDDE